MVTEMESKHHDIISVHVDDRLGKRARTEQAHDSLRSFQESGGVDALICDGHVGKGLYQEKGRAEGHE